MALTIRLQRCGSKNNPHFRLVVMERAVRRDGRYLELLGNYSPRNAKTDTQLKLEIPRIEHWIKMGAKMSDTAVGLVKRAKKAAAAAPKAA